MSTSYPNYMPNRAMGQKQFGKARVECTLLRSHPQWGILRLPATQNQQPAQPISQTQLTSQSQQKAASLLFQLKFVQPDTFSLRHAAICMEFCTPTNENCGPFIHSYAPDRMVGEPVARHETKGKTLEPELNLGGVAGGVGGKLGNLESHSDYTYDSRWSFIGYTPKYNDDGFYTAVAWNLDNPNNEGRSTERPFTTGTILLLQGEPTPKPFFVKLEIDGKLRLKRHFWRIFSFRSSAIRSADLVPETCSTDLDDLVNELPAIIKKHNDKHVAPELLDVSQAQPQSQQPPQLP